MKQFLLFVIVALAILVPDITVHSDARLYAQQEQKGFSETQDRYSMSAMRNKGWKGQGIRVISIVQKRANYTSYRLEFNVDGLREYALLSVPAASTIPQNSHQQAEGLGVLLLLHGYIPPDYYSTERSYPTVFARYANSEFAVIKPDYRGHDRSEGKAEVRDNRFFNIMFYTYDIRQLLASLYAQPLELPGTGTGSVPGAGSVRFSADKLFIMGHSMGGALALRLLQIYSAVQAVSLWGPVSVSLEQTAQQYGQLQPEPAAQIIRQRAQAYGITDLDKLRYNEVRHLRFIRTPLRIHHPDTDESVPIAWTRRLLPRLREANVPVSYFDYPGDNHNIARNQAQVQHSDLQWFRSLAAEPGLN